MVEIESPGGKILIPVLFAHCGNCLFQFKTTVISAQVNAHFANTLAINRFLSTETTVYNTISNLKAKHDISNKLSGLI